MKPWISENESQTHCSNVGVFDPGFENKRPDAIHNDNRVVILCSNSEDKLVASVPGSEIFPRYKLASWSVVEILKGFLTCHQCCCQRGCTLLRCQT